MTALALPDICGAASSPDGKATGPKYKAWLKQWVPQQAADAERVWGFRCSLLHQGRSLPHGATYPVAFIEPNPAVGFLHNLSTVLPSGEKLGWIDIWFFVDEVTRGVEAWVAAMGSTNTVTTNMAKFVKRYPHGLRVTWEAPL